MNLVSNEQRMGSPYCVTLAKYILIGLMVVFIVFLYQTNSSSRQPFDVIENAIGDVVNPSVLKEASDTAIRRYYGLQAADYEGAVLYTAANNMEANELLLIKVKDHSQFEAVEEAVQKRKELRINDFKGYLPEQVQQIENAAVTIQGTYLLFVIGSDSSIYLDTFLENL